MVDPQIEQMRRDTFEKFDRMGEDHVRLKLSSWDVGPMRSFAIEWLAGRNQVSRLEKETSIAEIRSLTARASVAAERAATAAESQARTNRFALIMAMVANIIAIIAAAIAIAGLLRK